MVQRGGPSDHERTSASSMNPEPNRSPAEADSPQLYRKMLLIRRFEDRVYRLFLDGEIPGTLHQYQGQEAVAAGVCDVLRRDDWITSTHRPHGHALAKGVSARAAMAELYGKATGCCGGKGGSMHLGDPAVGMLPAIAIVAGGNSVVNGLGLAMKLRRSDQVAACFFGEGATNEGAFHEGPQLRSGRGPPDRRLRLREQPLRRLHLLHAGLARARCRRPRRRPYWGACCADRRRDGRPRRSRGRRRPKRWRKPRAGNGPTLLECKTYRFTRPQPQRRPRLPHARRGGGVEQPHARPVDRSPWRHPPRRSTLEQLPRAEVRARSSTMRSSSPATRAAFPDPADAFEDVYAW